MNGDLRPAGILGGVGLLAGGVLFGMSFWFWWTFQYGTFDLAFYLQVLWQALHGSWEASLLGMPLLGNHAEPVVFLLVPIFALCPHPMLPVAVQSAVLASVPLASWRMANQVGIKGRESVWLGVLAIGVPTFWWAGGHEFHPETLSFAGILWMWEARLAGNLKRYWIWFLLVLGCKENLGVLLAVWSVVDLWYSRRRGLEWQWRWNGLPLLVAGIWVAAYGVWVGPSLNKGAVDYAGLYAHLGASPEEMIKNPGRIFRALLRGVQEGDLVLGLLGPVLGLPLLRLRWLLVAAPLFLQHLLSWRSSEWSVRFHYGAPLAALMWIATVEVLSGWPRFRKVWCACLACAAAFWMGTLGPIGFWAREWNAETFHRRLAARKLRADFIQRIPKYASVIAGLPYLSHLAMRPDVHSLHHVLKGLKTLSRETYEPPGPVDWVWVDFEDHRTFDAGAGYHHPTMRTVDGRVVPSSEKLLSTFLSHQTWRVDSVNGLALFSVNPPEMVPAPETEPLQVAGCSVRIRVLQGLGFVKVRFFWESSSAQKEWPWVRWVLRGKERVYTQVKGPVGLAGKQGMEEWTVRLPLDWDGRTGEMALEFYDPFSFEQKDRIQAVVPLGDLHQGR